MTSLKEKISTGQARIGVIGLGYVGLPVACAFARKGFSVTGFDLGRARIQALNRGQSHIADIPSAVLRDLVNRKTFKATTDTALYARQDVLIICVPTPLNKTKDPDISFIDSVAHQLAQHLRRGQLIILESTTYPGTTREYVLPILEKRGLKVGRDFHLAFSPERIDPGNAHYHFENTPKVVGGLTPACGALAELVYRQAVQQVVRVSSAEAAELAKLLENTFRAVNIGLVNEIALICDKLGLNVWEIIDAAASKPYGFMPFYPGPGLGGHCIPIDPLYLSWKMKSLNFAARFIELATDVNSHMPEYTVDKLARALNDRKRAVKGSRILVLGVAYKANVSDVRESPALDIIHLLRERGAVVDYHDPFVPSVRVGDQVLRSKAYSTRLLKSYDAVLIINAHQTFKPAELRRYARLIIDTRNLMRNVSASHVVRL